MERLCTLNTASLSTLSTRTHLPQSQYKTSWITFRGYSRSHILRSLKSRRGTAYYYIIQWALETEISKQRSASKISKTPLSFGAPIYGTHANICTNRIFPETIIIDLYFAPDSLGITSFKFFWWAPKNYLFLQEWRFVRSRSSKVIDFGDNRKRC